MWEKIGDVGVDSGQLMITDPCYLLNQWKNKEFVDVRILTDNKGNKYQYRKDFDNYESVLAPFNKTVNQLVEEGILTQVPVEETGEYSYDGASKATLSDKGYGQLNFTAGHAGAGVAFSSGYGDGLYPVYARKDSDGCIMEVRIMMDFSVPK